MDPIFLVRSYVEIHLFLAVLFGICLLLGFLTRSLRVGLRPGQLLPISYLLLLASLILPFFLPASTLTIHPPIQVWSAPPLQARSPDFHSATISFSSMSVPSYAVSMTHIEWGLLSAAVFGFAVGLVQLMRSIVRLRRVIRESFLIRRIGSIRILASECERTPYSFRTLRRHYVVIPSEMLGRPVELRVAIFHELQHHRQGDTLAVHGIELLKLLFFINPFVHFLENKISTFQEFACDECLVDRKKVSPHAYGSCLIWAAEHNLGAHRFLAGTTGMAVSSSGKQLKRRIEMMFQYQETKRGKWAGRLLGTVALIALVTTAYATQSLVRDRRISLEEAQQMANTAAIGSSVPIVVNDAVLEQLNRFVGTPDGRAYMRDAIANMQQYRPMMEQKIREYHLPEELLAIPIIESKYRNYKPASSPGAGLWMFITPTAQRYGLRVDDNADDRLNPDLETDAAMRYLGSNNLVFQDWLLSMLAYNAGEKRVQSGIDATGSRDAWKLVQAGFDGDKDYLAMVMASIIVMKNPSVLD